MGLALYLDRVRSNEVLERTRCHLRSGFSPLAQHLWRFAPSCDTGSKGASRSWCAGCLPCPSGATPLTLTAESRDSAR